jgi:hypothetical protein
VEGQLSRNGGHLVGGALTLADVCVACALLPLMTGVLSAEVRDSALPATTAWLAACCQHPAFSSVLGAVQLCPATSGWVAPAAADKGGKKKKQKGGAGGGGGSEQQQQQQQQQSSNGGAAGEELDPEKAAKKVRARAGWSVCACSVGSRTTPAAASVSPTHGALRAHGMTCARTHKHTQTHTAHQAAKLAEKEAKKAKAAAKAAAAAAAASGAAAGAGSDKKASKKAEADAKKVGCVCVCLCAV